LKSKGWLLWSGLIFLALALVVPVLGWDFQCTHTDCTGGGCSCLGEVTVYNECCGICNYNGIILSCCNHECGFPRT
jgi:hypothetical protein